eukprot:2439452-Pyramimonas_sp.AAC.1
MRRGGRMLGEGGKEGDKGEEEARRTNGGKATLLGAPCESLSVCRGRVGAAFGLRGGSCRAVRTVEATLGAVWDTL